MTLADPIAPLPDSPAGIARYYGDAPRGVRANMVTSVDGAGAFAGRTKAISSAADQMVLGQLRRYADAVMVGSATVQAEGYGPVRLDAGAQDERTSVGYAAVPPLVVVTARAALPATLKIFNAEGPRPIVATLQRSADAAAELRDIADVIIVGDDVIDPGALIAELARRGMHRVLCEGGPYLLSTLIEQDLVDDMCLTVSPYLAGSQPTTPQPASALPAPSRLTLRHVLTHDDLLYLRYTRDR
jgi:riboflavin biosynthesis pyrimidine reductase